MLISNLCLHPTAVAAEGCVHHYIADLQQFLLASHQQLTYGSINAPMSL